MAPKQRTVLLILALTAVSGGGIYLRYPNLREAWLRSRSLEAAGAAAAAADPLAKLIYAEKLIQAGKSPDALPVLGAAANALPANATSPLAQRVYARFGHALALNGYLDDAARFLEQARKLDGNDPRVFLGYTLLFLGQQMPDAAEKQARLATELAPDSPEGWYVLGRILNDTQRPESAIAPLKKALKLDPNFAAIHAELGHAYAFQAQFAPAIEEFRIATRLDPKNPEYRRAFGAALSMGARSKADYDEARKLLDECLLEDPKNETILYTLGQLHVRFNNVGEARTRLKMSLELNPTNAEAWYNLSLVERRLGNEADSKIATARFEHYSKLHDEMVVAEKRVGADLKNLGHRLTLARTYRRAGNIVGAYWQMRVALQMDPNQTAFSQEFEPVKAQYAELRKKAGSKPDNPRDMGPPPPSDAPKMTPPARTQGGVELPPPSATDLIGHFGTAPMEIPAPTPAPKVDGAPGLDDR